MRKLSTRAPAPTMKGHTSIGLSLHKLFPISGLCLPEEQRRHIGALKSPPSRATGNTLPPATDSYSSQRGSHTAR
eukprot:7388300-Prymnesium_polylepis.2